MTEAQGGANGGHSEPDGPEPPPKRPKTRFDSVLGVRVADEHRSED